jgi:hypothetical protein
MPFEPQPGEVVLFPAPFIANEPQKLVISTKRVVQYAKEGVFPVAEFPVDKIEHVGRMSERPTMALGILSMIVGLVFFIVFVAKVLPQVMYAGTPTKSEAGSDAADGPEEGIEGRDANDDDPFEKDKDKGDKESVSEKAKQRYKKVKEVKFGWPGFTEDMVVGFLFLLGAGIAGLIGRSMYGKERHMVFCRIGQVVYPIEVESGIQQNAVVSMIQAALQTVQK